MKLIIPGTGILLLLFTLPVANASGLQLAAASPKEKFEDECGQCHGDADEFVRESLTFKDATLTGLGSELPVFDFLQTHRKLQPAEVKFYTDLLNRVAGEVGLQ